MVAPRTCRDSSHAASHHVSPRNDPVRAVYSRRQPIYSAAWEGRRAILGAAQQHRVATAPHAAHRTLRSFELQRIGCFQTSRRTSTPTREITSDLYIVDRLRYRSSGPSL